MFWLRLECILKVIIRSWLSSIVGIILKRRFSRTFRLNKTSSSFFTNWLRVENFAKFLVATNRLLRTTRCWLFAINWNWTLRNWMFTSSLQTFCTFFFFFNSWCFYLSFIVYNNIWWLLPIWIYSYLIRLRIEKSRRIWDVSFCKSLRLWLDLLCLHSTFKLIILCR